MKDKAECLVNLFKGKLTLLLKKIKELRLKQLFLNTLKKPILIIWVYEISLNKDIDQ
jgi:hypothetical protein